MKKISRKKNNKKVDLKVSREDRFEFLLENMNDQMEIVAEGVATVNDKVDKLDGRFEDFKNEMDSFKIETESNFRLVFDHFSNLEDEIVEIRKDLSDIRKNVSEGMSVKEFDVFKDRLFKAEKEIKRLTKLVEQRV